MKKKLLLTISLIMALIMCLSLSACSNNEVAELETDIWAEAMYTQDTELGDGAKTVLVEVVAGDKSVTFTIHTDKNILGDVLAEHNLVEGEEKSYGLFVKKVNGMLADYDKNQCYWGLNQNGESSMTGVDGVEVKDGDHYEFVYTK